MAKKKGRRSVNVARKREKRNRDRKSRQKQIAIEKQRKLPYEKSEEAHLYACISQSRELLHEPELENVHFDFELMYTSVMELLEHYEMDSAKTSLAEPTESPGFEVDVIDSIAAQSQAMPEPEDQMAQAEQACEHFRMEVLPHLVTPEFMQRLMQTLTACETRLKRIGNCNMAEVAFVTRSLFELAPSDMLPFHPLIQSIGIQTLRMLVEEPNTEIKGREDVKGMLSDVLEYEDAEAYQSESLTVFSDVSEAELPNIDVSADVSEAELPDRAAAASPLAEVVLPTSEPAALSLFEKPTPETPSPTLSPDDLPARALYKNFEGLAIKALFETATGNDSLQDKPANYVLVNESGEQIEFVDTAHEHYITVTEDRLQLHARSEAELTMAMEELEAQCKSALMYLAKTIEERG